MLPNALLEGLTLGREGDRNPFKLGIIGSTDTHVSDSGNTVGMPAQFEQAAGISFAVERILELDHVVVGPVRRMSAGGLAGVWAESNTRADIFGALRRREAFATSGHGPPAHLCVRPGGRRAPSLAC